MNGILRILFESLLQGERKENAIKKLPNAHAGYYLKAAF